MGSAWVCLECEKWASWAVTSHQVVRILPESHCHTAGPTHPREVPADGVAGLPTALPPLPANAARRAARYHVYQCQAGMAGELGAGRPRPIQPSKGLAHGHMGIVQGGAVGRRAAGVGLVGSSIAAHLQVAQ